MSNVFSYIVTCTFCLQLEEANRTLTSDVANLANEKEELNNKLKEVQERMYSLNQMQLNENSIIFNSTASFVMNFNCFLFFNYIAAEITKLKEEEANIGNIKAQYEKQLLNERTLKTQVSKCI